MSNYKYDKYRQKYIFQKYGGMRLTSRQTSKLLDTLDRLYNSTKFIEAYSQKPVLPDTCHSSSEIGSDTEDDTGDDTGDETDEETCPNCSKTHYCYDCLVNNTCGCRMTALFYYIGTKYLSQHRGKEQKIPELISYILTKKDQYYQDPIISGILTRKQQLAYRHNSNHLIDGPNIVAIYQKFPNQTHVDAFHYLFVLKNGNHLDIRQSWYDGGTSDLKLNYRELEKLVSLKQIQQLVVKTEVTKQELLQIYGAFLSQSDLSDTNDIFPIFVLSSENDTLLGN